MCRFIKRCSKNLHKRSQTKNAQLNEHVKSIPYNFCYFIVKKVDTQKKDFI